MTEDEGCKRVADITQELEVARRHADELASERAGIVQILRADGWSLGKIATATGLSRSRVAQIAGGVPSLHPILSGVDGNDG